VGQLSIGKGVIFHLAPNAAAVRAMDIFPSIVREARVSLTTCATM
jgi:hypothetical protein